jgi:hypothetical protein
MATNFVTVADLAPIDQYQQEDIQYIVLISGSGVPFLSGWPPAMRERATKARVHGEGPAHPPEPKRAQQSTYIPNYI